MQSLGNQLLARTALALHQDGRTAGSNLRDQVEQTQHRLALAHDVLEVVPLLQRAFELYQLFFSAMPPDGGANIGQQLLVVPRLLNEVLRPRVDRIDHVRDLAKRRNHNDRQRRMHLQNPRQQVDSALSRQREVEQQQVELAALQLFQAVRPVYSQRDLESLQRQQRLQRLADRRLVVDDQNPRRPHHASIRPHQTWLHCIHIQIRHIRVHHSIRLRHRPSSTFAYRRLQLRLHNHSKLQPRSVHRERFYPLHPPMESRSPAPQSLETPAETSSPRQPYSPPASCPHAPA